MAGHVGWKIYASPIRLLMTAVAGRVIRSAPDLVAHEFKWDAWAVSRYYYVMISRNCVFCNSQRACLRAPSDGDRGIIHLHSYFISDEISDVDI